jgi:DNA-directed RNA polymerase specialized sigma24 family protein
MSLSGSFSKLLSRIKRGDESAVQVVWDRFFEPLQKLAKARVNANDRKARDEEDLALSAINAFQQCVKNGRYEKIEDRDDIWNLLVTIVERKAIDHVRKQRAQKRGAGKVRGDSFEDGLGHFAELNISHEEKVDFLDQSNLRQNRRLYQR